MAQGANGVTATADPALTWRRGKSFMFEPRASWAVPQPGSFLPQDEQVASVTRLPVPHDGHRFMPSVDIA